MRRHRRTVTTFLERPTEGHWPYLWRGATYVKARDNGRVAFQACVIAVGVNAEGRREELGLSTGPTESEAFWKAFLRSLIGRSW